MDYRTCPNEICKHEFKYPSGLKRHFQLSVICKKNPAEIKQYFEGLKAPRPINYKCNNCSSLYKNKSSLTRHLLNSPCIMLQQLPSLLQPQLQQLQNQPIQPLNTIPNIEIPHQVNTINDNNHHNVNHNENITNNTNNNNITINNNNTIVQHIYPLGYERLPNIPQNEMRDLLLLGDKGVVAIIKLVCKQDENKNFYKLNMNKTNISYLNDEYTVDICQESELKEKLLKQCVMLTYQMLLACSSIMSNRDIDYVNSNLQNVSKSIKEEIYDNGLRNIIEFELRTNNKTTKNKIEKYTKEISLNTNTEAQAKNKCREIVKIKNTINKSLKPSMSLSEINKKLGNPLTNPDLEDETTFNDFNLNRFETTKYSKYWNKRLKDEHKLIMSIPNKTIGDITNLESRKKEIKDKLEIMQETNNNMGKYNEQKELIITKDNFKVEMPKNYLANYRALTYDYDVPNTDELGIASADASTRALVNISNEDDD